MFQLNYISSLLILVYYLIPNHIDVDKIINSYNEKKYFPLVKCHIESKLQKNEIFCDTLFNRNENNKSFNILLIPQYVFKYDTINDKLDLYFDSINPINRAILFNKNKYLSSLLFMKNDTFFCPNKIAVSTNFNCGKNIYREANYQKSLKFVLRQDPILVFKDPNIERVWFYINRDKHFYAYTYDSICYNLDDFFNNENLSKYSIPEHLLIK